jgi:hypothetical protein
MDNGDDNSPPNASVTANVTDPAVDDTVALDASKSDDPDGDKLTFNWTLETPDGSNTALSAQAAVDPQFIPDTSGDYTARLEVDDGSLTDTDDLSLVAEDEPDSVTVKANLSTTDNGTLASCVVEFTPESGDTVTKNTCADPAAQFAQNSGTVEVTATADDYQQMEKTTSTKHDRTLEFPLEPETPDQSTVTFAVTEADTLVSVQVFVADTLAADGVEPTAVFPYDQTINARVESEFLKTTQISFTTDTEEKTVTVSLQRKTAEIAITPRDDAGNLLAEAKTVIREPNKTDSTTVTGDSSVQLPQLPGQRAIETRLITERADKPDRLIRYKPFSTTVSASEDADLRPNMNRLAACNDNISNELEEEANLVDENDPGCLNQEGEYEPNDDNEGHVFVRSIHISTSLPEDGVSRVISSADNNRRYGYPGGMGNDRAFDLPTSIVHAVIVSAGVDTERDNTQDDEAFAATFKCGSTRDNLTSVNTSGIVADNNEQHGWEFTEIPGVALDFFRPGQFCRIVYKHGTLVRDEPPGDGKDDVFYLKPDGENRAFVVSFFVEEEDYDSNENTSARNQARNNRCSLENAPCTQARTNGYPR